MPDVQLSNPAGLFGFPVGPAWFTTQLIEEYLYDPAVSAATVLNNGMVVFISGGYTVAGGDQTSLSATAYPVIRMATTTPAFGMLGVVVNAPKGGYVPGQIVQVCTKGVAQILMDANNTTFGHLAITGSTTAGAATDNAAATLGKTIGVSLQTQTISSGTALNWAYIGMM